MFREDSSADAAFRREVRDWLEANLPRSLRGRTVRPPPVEIMPWYIKLRDRGWVAPHWPKRWGGMEATLSQQIILSEELARISAPAIPSQGINHLGPILMKHGTDKQKETHLPRILRGDVIWAQGYSEPGSGSDLASLSTRAVLDGDGFIVNGRKIWQTWGHYADWMFMLVRTDPAAAAKQAGISFILLDLKTPGVKARPIINIADDDEFAEFTLDDVVVPRENLIGELHGGWKVANDLLAHERLGTSNPQYVMEVVERIGRIALANGADRDPVFMDRMAGLKIKLIAQAALFWHAVDLVANGKSLGPESSVLKLAGSDNLQAATDLLIEVAAGRGADQDGYPVGNDEIEATRVFLQSRRSTIYGGSNEIQRNVLARRVLGLPG